MGIERTAVLGCVRLTAMLASCCVLLTACQAPPPAPFSTPQPQPDWSDPEKQCKVDVEVLRCTESRPYTTRFPYAAHPGCWRLELTVRTRGSANEVVDRVSYGLCHALTWSADRCITLKQRDGKVIPLTVPKRVWYEGFVNDSSMILVEPILPEDPVQLPSGEWQVEFQYYTVLTTQLPVGEVDLAIDGEALRCALISEGERRLDCIPVGGLTGNTSVFTVPAPKADTPDAPPTSGAVIAPTAVIAPPANR